MPTATDLRAHRKLSTRFVLLLVACTSSPAWAAEFRVITSEAVAAASTFQWHKPVVRVTAISGDGTTIAGQIRTTGVDYDCAVN